MTKEKKIQREEFQGRIRVNFPLCLITLQTLLLSRPQFHLDSYFPVSIPFSLSTYSSLPPLLPLSPHILHLTYQALLHILLLHPTQSRLLPPSLHLLLLLLSAALQRTPAPCNLHYHLLLSTTPLTRLLSHSPAPQRSSLAAMNG